MTDGDMISTNNILSGNPRANAAVVQSAGRQAEWYRLLHKVTGEYVKGESSSLPIETAGSLLHSLHYTVSLAEGEHGAEGLFLDALCERGRALIDGYIAKAKRLFCMVKAAMLPVDMPCYVEAIEKGAPSFFKAYDPAFCAHETPGDFDYPASVIIGGSGVTWMLGFLEVLYWENLFCRRFPLCAVQSTLKAQGMWGEAVPLNIFEPVFAAAIHSCLLEKEEVSLCVKAEDNQRLLAILKEKTHHEISLAAKAALNRLTDRLNIQSAPYVRLLEGNALALVPRLVAARNSGSLNGLFPVWEAPAPKILAMDGDPMEEGAFRALAQEMKSCRFFSDKLRLVRENIRSLHDLTALVEAEGFDMAQARRLFGLLQKEELAALMAMGGLCTRVRGRAEFPPQGFVPKDAPLWEKALYAHVHNLSQAQQTELHTLAGRISLAE